MNPSPSALTQRLKLRLDNIIMNTPGDKRFSHIAIIAGRISEEYMKKGDLELMTKWDEISQRSLYMWEYLGEHNNR